MEKGNIIYADLIAVIPFENIYHIIELNGTAIREVLEFAVFDFSNVLQVAGIKVVYDKTRAPYDRIVDLKIICQACEVPHYQPIDHSKFYKIILPEYLALGGDEFTMIPKYSRNTIIGARDIDALVEYVEKMSPIALPPMSGRISFV